MFSTVSEVGSAVTSFRKGDKVAGFHEMDTPNGTYAEYAVCPEQTVFHLPESLSYEEAATMPLAIFTAAVGLYRNLDIPAPWDRSDDKAASTGKVALVVNAGSSSVGAFAIKLAKLNPRIGPIIATAGASADYVRSLGVDAVVDYHSENVAEEIRKAANGAPIRYVFDAANTLPSTKYLTAVMEKDGHYTCTDSIFRKQDLQPGRSDGRSAEGRRSALRDDLVRRRPRDEKGWWNYVRRRDVASD